MKIVRYVVLAAGESTRMGFDKVVTRNGSEAPLESIARALGERACITIVPPRLLETAISMMPYAVIVVNEDPTRGMTHSLRVALGAVPPDQPFGVLLGDMPAMTDSTIERTEALLTDDVDVAFPVDAENQPGHPVLFSARARAVVESLRDGDTLRDARDRDSLKRATWTCEDASAFLDLDLPAQWDAFRA